MTRRPFPETVVYVVEMHDEDGGFDTYLMTATEVAHRAAIQLERFTSVERWEWYGDGWEVVE